MAKHTITINTTADEDKVLTKYIADMGTEQTIDELLTELGTQDVSCIVERYFKSLIIKPEDEKTTSEKATEVAQKLPE